MKEQKKSTVREAPAAKEEKKSVVKDIDPTLDFSNEDQFADRLSMSQALKDEIASKGLAYRFINEGEWRRNFGRHKYGWRPYNISTGGALVDLKGLTPENVYRVGDLLLAVRPLEMQEKHKDVINKRRERLNNLNKTQGEELKDQLARAGVATKVVTGYDD